MPSIIDPTAPLFNASDRAFIEAVSRRAFANPFLPERTDAERAALGHEFVAAGPATLAAPSSTRSGVPLPAPAPSENLRRIRARLGPLLDRARDRLSSGAAASDEERSLYQDACVFLLFDRYGDRLQPFVEGSVGRAPFYEDVARDHARLLHLSGSTMEVPAPAHLMGCWFQHRRAFHFISSTLLGQSRPASRLRAAVWQSIFTDNLRRYQRSLFDTMHNVHTLITGPTGTGKELCARAIGLSRYLPFAVVDLRFVGVPSADFQTLNLSALSPSLVASELFGHKRGAFTGAVAERKGWLEVDDPRRTLFLDEIGEADIAIQVMLLRVLQTRSFQRIGEATERRFEGRIVAATHRDLPERMPLERFRQDLYYRLSGDLITTPSLYEQLVDAPGDRRELVLFIAAKVAKPHEADTLRCEVEDWIDARLPPDYQWPGNVRELEQVVRNVMVRHDYHPAKARPRAQWAQAAAETSAERELVRAFTEGRLSLEELVSAYTTLVFARTGTYAKAARRLGICWRTVAAKIDHALLQRITGPEPVESVEPRSRRRGDSDRAPDTRH